MKILWITWKDMGHPAAGGAEVVSSELCKKLLVEGHEVTLLTPDYPGAHPDAHTPGVRIIRIGRSRYTHPFLALCYYLRHLRNRYDVLIEEVQGGAPYFSVFFERRAKCFLFYHQLGRINWLYEVKKPFNYIGYFLLVPIATRLLSLRRVPVITVSESTRQELVRYGIHPDRIRLISEGIQMTPAAELSSADKYPEPTLLSHGNMRAMKRTLDQIKAFEIAKEHIPQLKLKISGNASGSYGRKVMAYIAASPYAADIEYLGHISHAKKVETMRRCHAILVTSIEEGWGLIVTEANSQGCPAVVYNVNGLRDSVQKYRTGIVTHPTPQDLALGILSLLKDAELYERLKHAAWKWSHDLTFDASYANLKEVIGL